MAKYPFRVKVESEADDEEKEVPRLRRMKAWETTVTNTLSLIPPTSQTAIFQDSP